MARAPCACNPAVEEETVLQVIAGLVEVTNPLHPISARQYFDGRLQYGWEVLFYVQDGHEAATNLQTLPNYVVRCQDRHPLYRWAQDLTPAGTHLEGIPGCRRLPMVRAPALEMLQPGALALDFFSMIAGKRFNSPDGTRLYPRALYVTGCNLCRRVR